MTLFFVVKKLRGRVKVCNFAVTLGRGALRLGLM